MYWKYTLLIFHDKLGAMKLKRKDIVFNLSVLHFKPMAQIFLSINSLNLITSLPSYRQLKREGYRNFGQQKNKHITDQISPLVKIPMMTQFSFFAR